MKYRLFNLILIFALFLSACSLRGAEDQNVELYLNIIWHQHQPFYSVDPDTGLAAAPWVRLHAAKDYVDMAAMLEKYPKIHATFNLTPSLLQQLKDLENGQRDLAWEMTLVPAENLTSEQKTYLLQRFFDTNGRVIARFPRYQELQMQRGGASEEQIAAAVQTWSAQDFRDLQVLFNLAWTDPDILAEEPLAALVAKGRNFSEADKQTVLQVHADLIAQVIPVHKKLQDKGQIEITFTPYAHPILPLLIDTEAARVAAPDITLPERFAYSEDAALQLERGAALYRENFGRKPRGMWPAEGSVAQLMVGMTARAGVKWMVTDEAVLAHSLGLDFTRQANNVPADAALYKPYTVRDGKDSLIVFFRDAALSNKVSFDYSQLPAAQAVSDFMNRIHAIRDAVKSQEGGPYVLTVILDGENAWEWYENDGKDFLNGIYTELSNDPTIRAVTPSEFLKQHKQEPELIPDLWAGSWDNATFETWIGELEENRAWNYLGATRATLEEYLNGDKKGQASRKALDTAITAMLAAEGSDWFWWYGSDKDSGNDAAFDAQFRETLGQVYDALGLARPAFLNVPIIQPTAREPDVTIKGLMGEVTIDGAMTTRSEWMNAGGFYFDSESPSTLGFGVSAENLYFALYQPIAGNYSLYLKIPSTEEGMPFAEENGQVLGFYATHRIAVRPATGGPAAALQRWNSEEQRWETLAEPNFKYEAGEMAEIALPFASLSDALNAGDSLLIRYADETGIQPAAPGRILLPELGRTAWMISVTDPANDDHGPGTYTYPTDKVFQPGVFDLLNFQVGIDGEMLVFRFEMRGPVENPWGSPNGLAIQLFDVYINTGTGANTMMRNGRNTAVDRGWDYALTLAGWGYGLFRAEAPEKAVADVPITIITDPGTRTVIAKIPVSAIPGDPAAWAYAVAVLSNDGYGINGVRDVSPGGGQWLLGGAPAGKNYTRIVDYLWPADFTPSQEEMLSKYAPEYPQVKMIAGRE